MTEQAPTRPHPDKVRHFETRSPQPLGGADRPVHLYLEAGAGTVASTSWPSWTITVASWSAMGCIAGVSRAPW